MPPGQKIQDAQALHKVIDGFCEMCEEQEMIPTDYRFCKYAGIDTNTLERYRREPEQYVGYGEALKKLVAFRTDWYQQAAARNPRFASMAILALKQPDNGGYVDKPVVNVEAKELRIVTDGVGDGAFD